MMRPKTTLITALTAIALLGCNRPLEVPETPDGVTLSDARTFHEELCPNVDQLAQGVDPDSLDALYVYAVGGAPIQLGARNTLEITVTNLGAARNVADWGVRVAAGGETGQARARGLPMAGEMDPCGFQTLSVEVRVPDDVRLDGATTRVRVTIFDSAGEGHDVSVDVPVDVGQAYDEICWQGPLEVALSTTSVERLYIRDVATYYDGDLPRATVTLVNLGEREITAQWGVLQQAGAGTITALPDDPEARSFSPCGTLEMDFSLQFVPPNPPATATLIVAGDGDETSHEVTVPWPER